MKAKLHAIAGVVGFICVITSSTAAVGSTAIGTPETIALVRRLVFFGLFVQILALLGAGASGVALLGKRTDSLALEKQKRGPRAFMTSLFVLLPSAWFLWGWAAEGAFTTSFYALQGVELTAQVFCAVMIGLNIRDGLALRGRISTSRASRPVIEQRDGGPLVVSKLPALVDVDGSALSVGGVSALCRCGASNNKPFCDGSHNEIGFDSTKSADRTKDEVLTYEGTEVTIHYNRLLCSHAAECGRRQKAAFDSSRTPWIIVDNATKEAIQDVVKACPSGALRMSTPGNAPEHAHADFTGITVERDGPYRVTGVPMASAVQAEGASPDKFVLCRCGASKNKPFCDGTHHDIGWKAATR